MNLVRSTDISWDYVNKDKQYVNTETETLVLTAPKYDINSLGSDKNSMIKYELRYSYYDVIRKTTVIRKETEWCRNIQGTCNVFYIPGSIKKENISLFVSVVVLDSTMTKEISCLPLFQYNWKQEFN
jgi:hypothetical protein